MNGNDVVTFQGQTTAGGRLIGIYQGEKLWTAQQYLEFLGEAPECPLGWGADPMPWRYNLARVMLLAIGWPDGGKCSERKWLARHVLRWLPADFWRLEDTSVGGIIVSRHVLTKWVLPGMIARALAAPSN